MNADHLRLAEHIVARGKALGAEEVAAAVYGGTQVTITRRDGKVEQATEASTRGMSVDLFVEQRYSSHSTSDLRPDAMEAFLRQAVDATRFLEPDPFRAQPALSLCGRGTSEEALDHDDPAWYRRTATDRGAAVKELEDAVRALHGDDVISSATYVAEGCAESVRVMSNGFSDGSKGAWYAQGAEMTLDEGNGKRPESAVYYGARYLADVPRPEAIAEEVVRRARERLGSRPIETGRYPMVLANQVCGQILGAFGGPLNGAALHQKRSCFANRVGTRVGSEAFTVVDDPTLPRGLGSRPWDTDALVARPRTIVEKGTLQQYNIGVYYGRKLGMPPTSGSRSNWVIPPGKRSVAAITEALPKAILVTGFLGGNSNPTTGDFSFGIRGTLLERGQPTVSLSEMNVTGNVTSLFFDLVEVADDPWRYSSVVCPTLLFEGVQFSGT